MVARLAVVRVLVTAGGLVGGLLGLLQSAHGDDTTDKLRFIAKANTSAIESIRTVEAAYTRRHYIVSGGSREELHAKALHAWWWKDGTRHRFKYYIQGKQAKQQFVDNLQTDEHSFVLTNYDWDQRPAVAIGKHQGIYAEIAPRSRTFHQIDPMFDVCLHVQERPTARTLEQLLEAIDYRATLEETNLVGAGKAYQISLRLPEDQRALTIVVDPGADYLIRTSTISPTAASAEQGGGNVTWNVSKFEDVSGISFPAEVITSTQADPKTASLYEVVLQFSTLSVNKPVPTDQFSFKFPENVAVKDKTEGAVHIWGDNRPARTIRSLAEDKALASELRGPPQGQTSRFSSLGLLIAGGVVALGIIAYLVGRRLRA